MLIPSRHLPLGLSNAGNRLKCRAFVVSYTSAFKPSKLVSPRRSELAALDLGRDDFDYLSDSEACRFPLPDAIFRSHIQTDVLDVALWVQWVCVRTSWNRLWTPLLFSVLSVSYSHGPAVQRFGNTRRYTPIACGIIRLYNPSGLTSRPTRVYSDLFRRIGLGCKGASAAERCLGLSKVYCGVRCTTASHRSFFCSSFWLCPLFLKGEGLSRKRLPRPPNRH